MGKDSPDTPDYVGAAQATADSSAKVTNAQTYANRPDVQTPWGKQTYTNYQGVDPATGQAVTKWNQTITLDPSQQAALDSQQRIQAGRSAGAETLLAKANQGFQTGFDWNGLPAQSGAIDGGPLQTNAGQSGFSFGSMNGTSDQYRQRAQDAVERLQQPGLDARREQAQSQLANQGLDTNSEAYKNSMRDVDDAEARARLQAIDSGRQESAQMYNQDLSTAGFNNQRQAQDQSQILARGTFGNQAQTQTLANQIQEGQFNNSNRSAQIAEQQLKRGMTLNELNALLTGQQVATPQFGAAPTAGAAKGVDMSGAVNSQYSSAVDMANANNQQSASTAGAATSALAMAAMFAFSDSRLKEDITEVGLLPSGVRVVHYRYRGRSRRFYGVIAQEVARIIPEAVVLHPSGFLMVDYSKVH